MNSNDLQEFLTHIDQLIELKSPLKITLSKPRQRNHDTIKTMIRMTEIKGDIMYTTVYRQKSKDITKNYRGDELKTKLRQLLAENFFNGILITETEEWNILQNKKGNGYLSKTTKGMPTKISTEHDIQKERLISKEQPYLVTLGIASAEGRIYDKAQDKYRQIQKFIEIIDTLTQSWEDNRIYSIADMGSGKGYLTFALFDFLTHERKLRVKVTGYEIRNDLVTLCYQTALECGYMGLNFEQKSIDQISLSKTDMVIALHACDIATDMAIAKGISAEAELIVVSPCCHKQVRKNMTPPSAYMPMLKHGILMERQAEIITDSIRALLLESRGYKAQVFEFIDSEHTGKNLMITAQKSSVNEEALAQIEKIKTMYGLSYHELEKLIQ